MVGHARSTGSSWGSPSSGPISSSAALSGRDGRLLWRDGAPRRARADPESAHGDAAADGALPSTSLYGVAGAAARRRPGGAAGARRGRRGEVGVMSDDSAQHAPRRALKGSSSPTSGANRFSSSSASSSKAGIVATPRAASRAPGCSGTRPASCASSGTATGSSRATTARTQSIGDKVAIFRDDNYKTQHDDEGEASGLGYGVASGAVRRSAARRPAPTTTSRSERGRPALRRAARRSAAAAAAAPAWRSPGRTGSRGRCEDVLARRARRRGRTRSRSRRERGGGGRVLHQRGRASGTRRSCSARPAWCSSRPTASSTSCSTALGLPPLPATVARPVPRAACTATTGRRRDARR